VPDPPGRLSPYSFNLIDKSGSNDYRTIRESTIVTGSDTFPDCRKSDDYQGRKVATRNTRWPPKWKLTFPQKQNQPGKGVFYDSRQVLKSTNSLFYWH